MNKHDKAEYDFKAIKETVKNSLIIHKDILLEIVKSLEKRHLKLLERATPKKPLNEPAGYFCPTCNQEVYNMTYCADCGQHLKFDWGE